MELSDSCIKSLCGLAIAGGTLVVGLGGIVLTAGTVELLTNAGNLALSVNAGQEKELEKIEKAVTKSITKSYKSWLAADHGDDWAKKSDVTAALEQLGDAIRQSTPRMQDMIDVGHKSEVFARLLLVRLPEKNLFRTSAIATKIFVTFLVQTHGLVRVNETLKPMMDSLTFEKLFDLENAAIADRSEKHEETRTSHEKTLASIEELKQVIAREKGVAPKALTYLFEKVGQKVPEENFEAEVRKAVDTLIKRGDEPVEQLNDGAAINIILQNARDHLKKGEVLKAIESLKSGRDEQKQLRDSKQRGEARLAFEAAKIHQAIYARKEAIAAFQDGLELDPENLWARSELAREWVLFGNIAAAKAEAKKGLDYSADDSRERSVFHNKLGDVQVSLGELENAQISYTAGMLVRERLSQSDPLNSQWQRDLSVSHNKLGDAQVSLGELENAQISYTAGMLICERLSQLDPLNSEWQRDLSISHNKLGDVQVLLGELEKAQGSYEAGMLIREGLCQSDPSNSLWQRDLSISHNKLGDVQVLLGELEKAQDSYEAGILIQEGLSQSDPSNSEWQRDLIISHVKLSEASAEPAEYLRKALAIVEALKSAGKLVPADDWMIEDLKKRIAALD